MQPSTLDFDALVAQIFLARPCLTAHSRVSPLMKALDGVESHISSLDKYLTVFGRDQLDQLDDHTTQIRNALPEMISHFSVIADCENVH